MTVQTVPFALQNAAHSAAVFRQAMSAPFTAAGGILTAGELLVSAQSTPNMSVIVGPGRAKVPGTNVASAGTTSGFTTQALYDVLNDANVTLTVAAADPTNARVDAVYIGVQDSYYSGSNNQSLVGIVTGIPAPTPTQPAVPSNSIILGTIAVAANATSITSGNISGTGQQSLAQLAPVTYTTGAFSFSGIYSAGGASAPYVASAGPRTYLEGTVASSSATFNAGTSYFIGTFPSSFAPSKSAVFSASTNSTAVAAVTVSTNGSVSFISNTTFTGVLALWLSGINWRTPSY